MKSCAAFPLQCLSNETPSTCNDLYPMDDVVTDYLFTCPTRNVFMQPSRLSDHSLQVWAYTFEQLWSFPVRKRFVLLFSIVNFYRVQSVVNSFSRTGKREPIKWITINLCFFPLIRKSQSAMKICRIFFMDYKLYLRISLQTSSYHVSCYWNWCWSTCKFTYFLYLMLWNQFYGVEKCIANYQFIFNNKI